MACCGRWRSPAPRPVSRPSAAPVTFEYRGHGPLTLFGRVTGRRYHFPGVGARATVDGRDAPVLDVIRGLERVSS
jgi:hypothetical protein